MSQPLLPQTARGSQSGGSNLVHRTARPPPPQFRQSSASARRPVASYLRSSDVDWTKPAPHHPLNSPRASAEAHQATVSATLCAPQIKRSWRFLGADALRLHPRERQPTPPLEVYRTNSRLERIQSEIDAANVAEVARKEGVELVDLDGDGDVDVVVQSGAGASAFINNLRAELNVSPTRRFGRVVMLEHNGGMIFDEDSCAILRFDPRDVVVQLKISSTVTYNRQRDANGVHTAIRLMKSQQQRARSNSAGASSNDGAGASTSRTNSPLQQSIAAPPPPSGTSGFDTQRRGDGSARAPNNVRDDTDMLGIGLEYHTFLMKAKGKKGVSITAEPETVNEVVAMLRDEFQVGSLSADYEQQLQHAALQGSGVAELSQGGAAPPLKSVFDGKDNRAPDECADEWERRRFGGGVSGARGQPRAVRHAHWFLRPEQWVRDYEARVHAATARAEAAKARAEAHERAERDALKAEWLRGVPRLSLAQRAQQQQQQQQQHGATVSPRAHIKAQDVFSIGNRAADVPQPLHENFIVAKPQRRGSALQDRRTSVGSTTGKVSPYRIRTTQVTQFVRRLTAVPAAAK